MRTTSGLRAASRIVLGSALLCCISCPADPPGEGFLDLITKADRTGAEDVKELRVRPVRIEAILSDEPEGEQRTVMLTVDNPSLVLVFGSSTEAISLATLSVPIGFLHQLRLIAEHVEVLGPTPVELPPCDGPDGDPARCDEPTATSDGAALARVPSGPQTGIKIVPEDGEPFPIQEGLTTKILVEFFVRDELRRPPGQGYLFGPSLEAKLIVATEGPDARPGELIIGFDGSLGRADWDDVLDTFDERTRIRFVERASVGLVVARIPDDKSIEDALEHFAAREEVRYVLPNGIVRLTQDNPRPAGAPDDPEADNQIEEYLDHIGVPRAWDRQIGSMDIVVALLDTGISLTQPEIVPNLFLNEREVPPEVALVDTDSDGLLTFSTDFRRAPDRRAGCLSAGRSPLLGA